MANIFGAGLRRLRAEHVDLAQMTKGMEEAAQVENTVGIKPIGMISVMASLAPMFGLLGTVDGMIKAFNKIGLGGMGDPEALAADIGEAMITTWFGLVIGIPAMALYFWLKSRFNAQMASIGHTVGELEQEIAIMIKRVESGEFPVEAIQLPDTSPAAAMMPPQAPPAS